MAGPASVVASNPVLNAREELQQRSPKLFKELDQIGLEFNIRRMPRRWGGKAIRLYIYEPGQKRLVYWYNSLADEAVIKTKLYRVFTPPTRYTFQFYPLGDKGGLNLIGVGFTLGVEKGSRSRAALSMPNGHCRGFDAITYWPNSTISAIMNDYWQHGFNTDNGYPKSMFFSRLRSKTGCSSSDIFAAWEELSDDEVMELVSK